MFLAHSNLIFYLTINFDNDNKLLCTCSIEFKIIKFKTLFIGIQ